MRLLEFCVSVHVCGNWVVNFICCCFCLSIQMASPLMLVFLTALPGVLCYDDSFIDLEAKGSEYLLNASSMFCPKPWY